jgi:hypothetical protein
MSSQPTRTLQDRLDASAEAWRPNPGDKLIGTVVDVDLRASDYGDPYPIVTVQRDDGTEAAFHGFHTVARRELAKKQPQFGDQIGIKYVGKGEPAKPGMSGAELYKIVVEHDDAPAVDWSQIASTEDTDAEQAATREQPAAASQPDADIPF